MPWKTKLTPGIICRSATFISQNFCAKLVKNQASASSTCRMPWDSNPLNIFPILSGESSLSKSMSKVAKALKVHPEEIVDAILKDLREKYLKGIAKSTKSSKAKKVKNKKKSRSQLSVRGAQTLRTL